MKKSTIKLEKNDESQSSPEGYNNNLTYLSIVDDINFDENLDNQVKKFIKDNNMKSAVNFNSCPFNTDDSVNEIDAGYLEEDDDDDLNSCKLISKRGRLQTEDSIFNIEKDFTYLIKEQMKNRNNPPTLELIKDKMDLDKILSRKKSYRDTYNVVTEFIENDGEKIEIIKGELFLIILQHLYLDIHNDICELAASSKEDRLRYISTDIQFYITKIENLIREKEEIFLCILAEIHTKLNFNENVFNDTMNYYSKKSNSNDVLLKDIILAIDKLYTAGFKEYFY